MMFINTFDSDGNRIIINRDHITSVNVDDEAIVVRCLGGIIHTVSTSFENFDSFSNYFI